MDSPGGEGDGYVGMTAGDMHTDQMAGYGAPEPRAHPKGCTGTAHGPPISHHMHSILCGVFHVARSRRWTGVCCRTGSSKYH